MTRTILLTIPLALALLAGCRDQELPTVSAPEAASHAVSVGSMTDLGTLPDGTFSYASDINNRGQIVGSSTTASGEEHAVLWQDGSVTDLGTLGGTYSQASAINARGQIVGVSETAAGEWHAFVVNTGPGSVSQKTSVTPGRASLNRATAPRAAERPAALERHLLRCGLRAAPHPLNGDASLGRCRP